MRTIIETDVYAHWFARLPDARAKARINARMRRAELGNVGDCMPVGEGVSEMRIHFGPGYRIYFIQRGESLLVLLGGGDKSTQQRDIDAAIALAKSVEVTEWLP